jgi:hypothetical protein
MYEKRIDISKLIYVGIMVIVLLLGSYKKQGCTDPTALNFDQHAERDNGTCQYK